MLDLLLDGLESAILPCSLVLLVPGFAAIVGSGKERMVAAAGFFVSAISYVWVVGSGNGGPLSATSAGIIFAAASLAVLPRTSVRGSKKLSAMAGILTGIAAAVLWAGCSGSQLADMNESLPGRGFAGLVDQAIYLTPILLPLGITLLLLNSLKPKALKKIIKPAGYIGATLLMIFALLTISDNHDPIINQLIS